MSQGINIYKKDGKKFMIFELDQMATEMAGYHKNLEEMGNSL